MTHYIIQTIAFQLLFLVVYDLFLKKETFFNANRIYLLITPILSFVLPLVKINAVQQAIPQEYYIQLPAVILGGNSDASISTTQLVANSWWVPTAAQLWILGITISLVLFVFKLIKIYRLKQRGTTVDLEGLKVVQLSNSDTAFSFFNMIFIGSSLSEANRESIIAHEKVHIEQRHSLDLLFFEGLRIVCWFNPLVYIFQRRIATLQEYMADAKVAVQKDKSTYYQDLLSQVFQTDKISFINTFFNHSLIKNRIVMLQKSKSKKIFQLKYLLLVPVVGAMLIYTSCTQEVSSQETSETAELEFSPDGNSDILQKIAALKESIAAKGEMTKEEEIALKKLFVLTSKEGVNNAYFDDVKDELAIPFGVIHKGPIYPGCEGLSDEAAKKCSASKISELVGKEFDVKLANKLKLEGRIKIAVQFKINNQGQVENIRARAPHPGLETEAIRVVSMIPAMQPGEHDGKKVGVVYSLPIVFQIDE